MLNLNQIESFYPENLRIFKRNLLREYLQYVILDIIYSSEYGNRLVFMGGTAIHIIYGNRRFSENLDFDNKGLDKEDFEDLAQKILAILNRPRAMGRDFYDAIFLFSKTNPNFNFLKEKMKLKENINTKEIKEKLLLKCEKINFKELAEDLKPFLFYPSDAKKILLFTELIKTKMT